MAIKNRLSSRVRQKPSKSYAKTTSLENVNVRAAVSADILFSRPQQGDVAKRQIEQPENIVNAKKKQRNELLSEILTL